MLFRCDKLALDGIVMASRKFASPENHVVHTFDRPPTTDERGSCKPTQDEEDVRQAAGSCCERTAEYMTCDSHSCSPFLDLYRILCSAYQAASVIQKHWVEGELAPDVDDDPVARKQVIFRWVMATKEPVYCP